MINAGSGVIMLQCTDTFISHGNMQTIPIHMQGKCEKCIYPCLGYGILCKCSFTIFIIIVNVTLKSATVLEKVCFCTWESKSSQIIF